MITRTLVVVVPLLLACRPPAADAPAAAPVPAPAPVAARAAPPPVSAPAPRSPDTVLLDHIPFVHQEPDFCGEACVAMATARLGQPWDQDAVFAATGLDPTLGRGAYTRELTAAIKRIGFEPGPVWTSIDARDPGPGLDAAFAALRADLARGVPSIVCMHYDDRPDTTEHFRLVTGYDADRDEIVYQEPAEDDGAARRMSRERFFARWPLPAGDAARRTLVRLALAPRPGGIAAAPTTTGRDFAPAAYAQHILALRAKLAAKGLRGLSIRIEPPFVVIGDDRPAGLARRARTVRWAADRLEADFFARRPARILDIFLFTTPASYQRGAKLLAGDAPDTPYGFYSSDADALIMNISTGGGTLVHEIVHPYVEADLPDAPPWLNEGLGSLFEQADEDGHDHIVGRVNWRLPGLLHALRRHDAPSFRALTAMDETAFYADDTGVHYAEARYLLYWLQERGLLHRFYEQLRAHHDRDPTGFDTLSAVLGVDDADDARRDWESFVVTLRFP